MTTHMSSSWFFSTLPPSYTLLVHHIMVVVFLLQVLLSLHSDPSFKEYLSVLENRPACNHLMLESLLEVPLRRLQTYVKDLEELRIKTPADHVDYKALITTIAQLESIIKVGPRQSCCAVYDQSEPNRLCVCM